MAEVGNTDGVRKVVVAVGRRRDTIVFEDANIHDVSLRDLFRLERNRIIHSYDQGRC